MNSFFKKIYKALSAILHLMPSPLLIAAMILLIVMLSSSSCVPAGKKSIMEPGGQSLTSSEELAPESNNYQGLRFETARLSSSRVSGSFPRLVCLGDSVTFGWNISYERSFPYLLEERLKKHYPEVMVINSGIGGQTVIDGLDRLDSDVSYYGPQVVIINFGLNDAFIIIEEDLQGQNNSTPDQTEGEEGNFESDGSLMDEDIYLNNVGLDTFASIYRQLIGKLSEKGLDILIMGANPVMTELLWENNDIALKQEESYRLYNQAAKNIAEDHGLVFVDLREVFMAGGQLDTLIQPDGVHPNEIGLALISDKLSIVMESVDLAVK